MLNITGGEPLLRKDLFEIMEYASNLGFNWGMVTNGTLINTTVIENMKRTNMSTISISLDGVGETHNEFRHLPGSFDKIISNIKLLQQANFLEHIQVTFIANKKNIKELPKLYNILNDLHITSLRISSIDPIGRAEDNKDLLLDKEDFLYLSKFIKDKNAIKNSLPCIWSCSHYLGEYLNDNFICHTGKHIASILSNGDIFACPNIPRLPQLIQGNIKKDKFSDIWNNKFEIYRNRLYNKQCLNCEHFKKCKGDSFHTWDFNENKPKICYKEIFKSSLENYKDELKRTYKNISIYGFGPNTETEVIIEPIALKDISNYFHIGKYHPSSMFEQQMGLVGYKIENTYFVKYAFPSFIKNRTDNMGYVNNETIEEALRETDIINTNLKKLNKKSDLKFLGFAHSHPMETNFNYSEGDFTFHKNVYNQLGDYISILINPQYKLLASFYGKTPKQCLLKIIKEKKE